MSEYGIKVSKSGKDVFSAEEMNLVLLSERNVFKVFKKGSWQINLDSDGYGEIVIPHNLGYIPNFVVLGQRKPGGSFYPYTFVESLFYAYAAYINENDLKIIAYNDSYPNETLNGVYIIYLDPM